MVERERDREDSVASFANESADNSAHNSILSSGSSENSTNQSNIDLLFERDQENPSWEPPNPPPVLGELLDSRYMLPLLFPSDPRMLAVLPNKLSITTEDEKRRSSVLSQGSPSGSRASSRSRGGLYWRSRNRKLREVGLGTLKWVDGVGSISRWTRPLDDDEDEEDALHPHPPEDPLDDAGELQINTHITAFTRKPSGRQSKGRPSFGGEETTPIDRA